MILLDYVSYMATTLTIGQFLTGVSTCRKILKNNSTSNIALTPWIVFFASSTMWLKYGLLKFDSTIIFVNLVSILLHAVYLSVYYQYTVPKGPFLRLIGAASCYLFPVLIYIRYFTTSLAGAITTLGSICMLSSIAAYSSPLASLKEVLKSRSTDIMSFPLCSANFIVAAMWMWYGILKDDFYIKFPNILGAILGIIQCSLFLIYPQSPETKSTGSVIGV